MRHETILTRIAALDTNDAGAVAAFVRQITDEGRESARALVHLWCNQTVGMPRERPMILIPELEDLAIRPLLEISTATLAPSDHAWLLHAVVEAEVELRNAVVQRLLRLLEDVTAVPQEVLPHSEGQPLPRRICDEAYLALRRLLQLSEDSQAVAFNANAFLFELEPRRDEEIHKLKSSRTFTPFVEGP